MLKPLYRDGHWLALDKPSGLVTTPPTTRGARTLLDVARELAPRASHHHALSRLDAEVSGVVLFALVAVARRASRAVSPIDRDGPRPRAALVGGCG